MTDKPTQYRPRVVGKRFEQFNELIKWASEGKTFIFMHPDMVAIDMKTWNDIKKILQAPKEVITYYDEYTTWSKRYNRFLIHRNELRDELRKKVAKL